MLLETFNEAGEITGLSSSGGKLPVKSEAVDAAQEGAKAGDFYSFTSDYTPSDDDYTLFFKNTGAELDFYVTEVSASTTAAAIFDLLKATGGGDGAVVSGVNWKLGSVKTADADCRQNPSKLNVTTSGVLGCNCLTDRDSGEFSLRGSLVLSPGDAIAVHTSLGGARTLTTITGYYA